MMAMMNEKLMRLAKQADFCFWDDEHYGPGPGNIDWGPSYDKELVQFAHLLIREVLDLSAAGTDVLAYHGIEPTARVDLMIDLEDDLLMFAYEEAHRRDITMNKLVEQILVEEINRRKGADSE
jgi:hypothetical protein